MPAAAAPVMNDFLELLAWYLAFLLSTSFHEGAHAWVARWLGDPTAYLGGQASLDPTPHIRREPFGMVVLPVLSLFFLGWPLGFASVPVDPNWSHRFPRKAGKVALAGPAANLVLVLLAGLLIRVGLALGGLAPPVELSFEQLARPAAGEGAMPWAGVSLILSVFFTLNLVLLLFNLLPLPPMDGATVANLLLPESAARSFQEALRQPFVGILGLILAWTVFPEIFVPVFRFAMNLLYSGILIFA